jgi:hypothetical protein
MQSLARWKTRQQGADRIALRHAAGCLWIFWLRTLQQKNTMAALGAVVWFF